MGRVYRRTSLQRQSSPLQSRYRDLGERDQWKHLENGGRKRSRERIGIGRCTDADTAGHEEESLGELSSRELLNSNSHNLSKTKIEQQSNKSSLNPMKRIERYADGRLGES